MLVLGIDAGGSKTVCYLADDAERVHGEGRAGGANLQAQGELEVEKVLHEATEQALGSHPGPVAAVCVGMAGADRETDHQVVAGIMRRLGFRVPTLIVSDARVALVAGCGDTPGVVIISGTGSICYGVDAAGRAARAGGWGYVLADEGSGYWIGREALMAVMRAFDGRGPATRLTPVVLDHFGARDAAQLVPAVYDGGLRRDAIAALAPLVSGAVEAGDPVAGEILSRAASELARAAESVISRLDMRGAVFPTLLAGGAFRAAPSLAVRLTALLGEVAPRSTVAPLAVEPAVGAVRLAIAEAAGRGLRPPPLGASSS
ncbi:MAG: BadF/BadG/BcrA/BcrD ATPase family protein [Acidobacteriota bacterium]